jgi:uncharacterized protein
LSQPISFQTEFTIENFFRKLKEDRKLYAGRCKKCGYAMIPPRPICSRCLSSNLEWIPLPEGGKIISFSEVHVSNEFFQRIAPYIVCIASFGELKIPGIIKEPTKRVTVGGNVRIEIQPERKPGYVFALS